MRKILNNKVYDSDTAKLVCRYENNKSRNVEENYIEDLYRKKNQGGKIGSAYSRIYRS